VDHVAVETSVGSPILLNDGVLKAGGFQDHRAKIDPDLEKRLDTLSIEDVVEFKLSRFFDQVGSFYPNDVHDLVMGKMEKPLLMQILRRVGGNQVHASRILGINRNTLRKKIKMYGI